MKTWLPLAVIALAVGCASLWSLTAPAPLPAQDKPKADAEKPAPKKTALKLFMRKKLEASQKILEGLTVEDYDLIRDGAKQLKGISAATEFVVSRDQLYIQHADDFRRIVDRLEKMGKERRLDASALAYMDMTMSCIECHRFSRTILIAQ